MHRVLHSNPTGRHRLRGRAPLRPAPRRRLLRARQRAIRAPRRGGRGGRVPQRDRSSADARDGVREPRQRPRRAGREFPRSRRLPTRTAGTCCPLPHTHHDPTTRTLHHRRPLKTHARSQLDPSGEAGCIAANGYTNTLEAAGRARDAIGAAKTALESAPFCHYLHHNLGRMLRPTDVEGALWHARRAATADPSRHEYQVGLGAALHSAARYDEAVQLYRSAIFGEKMSDDHRLMVDLASALHQGSRPAESVAAYAAALPHQLADAARALPATPKSAGDSNGPKSAGDSNGCALTVVFYCRLRAHAGRDSAGEGVWGPSSLSSGGVGGSEEAVIFISRDLARRGWRVIVYANPADDDVGNDGFGVEWRRWYEIDMDMAPDAFVAWRNPEAAALLPRAKRRCATNLLRDYYVITM